MLATFRTPGLRLLALSLAAISSVHFALVLLKFQLYAAHGLVHFAPWERGVLGAAQLLAVVGAAGFLWQAVRPLARGAERRTLQEALRPAPIGHAAAVLAAWYVGSFAAFFAIDGTFSRGGGSTPYCYPRVGFELYEPLWELVSELGWMKRGGGRIVAEDLAWTARFHSTEREVDARRSGRRATSATGRSP